MGFFDRFTSKKGKDQTAGPKRGVVKGAPQDAAEKKAFGAVPSAKDGKVKPKGKAPAASPPAAVVSTTAHHAHRVLLRPIVTEKSTRGGAMFQYTFEVAPTATKAAIRQSVHHLYGVTPVAVNVIRSSGRVVRFGRIYGQSINRKKAVVTLPAGKTIDIVSA